MLCQRLGTVRMLVTIDLAGGCPQGSKKSTRPSAANGFIKIGVLGQLLVMAGSADLVP